MTKLLYLLLPFFVSCVSISNLTTRGAASIVAPSEIALQDISDLESWRRGGPAGIQMLEGMHEASPDNTDITIALTKAYNGYATLVAETDMLEDTILDRSFSSSKNLGFPRWKNFHRSLSRISITSRSSCPFDHVLKLCCAYGACLSVEMTCACTE